MLSNFLKKSAIASAILSKNGALYARFSSGLTGSTGLGVGCGLGSGFGCGLGSGLGSGFGCGFVSGSYGDFKPKTINRYTIAIKAVV